MATQPMLLEMPERESPPSRPSKPAAPRLKEPNRDQFVMDSFDLDKLIPENHLARGIAALVESLPTEGFLKENKSVEGHAGRPRLSPKMLLSMSAIISKRRFLNMAERSRASAHHRVIIAPGRNIIMKVDGIVSEGGMGEGTPPLERQGSRVR